MLIVSILNVLPTFVQAASDALGAVALCSKLGADYQVFISTKYHGYSKLSGDF
jgi:hypothetical protein